MARIRESLLAAIFAFSAPWAAADSITVNTTTDDFADNSLCSLREAVEYFNRGKPAAGFQGCKSIIHDSYGMITLPANTQPYVISRGPITIGTDLIISGAGRTGSAITTLQVTGSTPDRAFIINNNPQYVAPRCASGSPAPCATSASTFDLDPGSDTGTPGDYLTYNRAPQFNGSYTPPTSQPPAGNYAYIVRIYDTPKGGTPSMVGSVKVPYSTLPVIWSTHTAFIPDDGVHHFTYTVQTVDNFSNNEIFPETAQSAAQVWVAFYTQPIRRSVQFTQMIIKGACSDPAIATCAQSDDDNTTIINDPSNSATYDPYGLSYTNGLINTAGNGGVIFNNEALTLSNVLLQYGAATQGGGIYNTSDAGISANATELRENRADAGAALFSQYNSVDFHSSLAVANVVNNAAGSGAVIQVANATLATGIVVSLIQNATISSNTGRALSLRGGSTVNAATVILNSGGGLDFNGEDVAVYNTILSGNLVGGVGVDCENLPATTPKLSYDLLVSGDGCPGSGNQVISNLPNTTGQLMATLVNGKCTSDFGLLCPLADHGGATFVHMPHILPSYASDPLLLGASPIINKGSTAAGGLTGSCPADDQRGKARGLYACDIGSVQVQGVASNAVTTSGGTIQYGQTYTQYLGDNLADEELLPASLCPAGVMLTIAPATTAALYPPSSLAPDPTIVAGNTYRSDAPGCPWVQQLAGRGQVTFDTNGYYFYKPNYDFHGFDSFSMRVVTTLSFLSALPADRSHLISARVVDEPNTKMTSSKVSGSLDFSVLLLLGVAGIAWRRGVRE